jgi:predicted acetyltransferase
VDWAKFAFDIALEIVMKKLGPAESMEKVVIASLTTGAEKISVTVAKKAFAKTAGVAYEALLKQSLQTAQKMLSKKDVTWEEFTKEVQKDLVKNFAAEVGKIVLKK